MNIKLRMSEADTLLPGEWHPQAAVLLAWPDSGTDWAPVIDEVEIAYRHIAIETARRQPVFILCREPDRVIPKIPSDFAGNVHFFACNFNDTWIRDYGPISVFCAGRPVFLDFGFDGWGAKFNAGDDNDVTSRLYHSKALGSKADYLDCRYLIMEGGSIESDGRGTLLSTERCLIANSRNPGWSRERIQDELFRLFGLRQIIWLRNGYLEGDDTDGHIDTLARFCSPDTIAYVHCSDPHDSHYEDLRAMERELQSAVDADGKPYNLVPLPMAEPLYDDHGQRLPATYANFLIINDAVLMPVYGTPLDREVLNMMKPVFPGRDIVPIDCRTLILQGGALHCASMQIPKGAI